jgi:hypothetical protein
MDAAIDAARLAPAGVAAQGRGGVVAKTCGAAACDAPLRHVFRYNFARRPDGSWPAVAVDWREATSSVRGSLVPSATKCVLAVALVFEAFVPSAAMSYSGASAFFNKTFVVTFDLGPNYQLIAGHSNVEFRFYVSSDGEVFFYSPSTEKPACSRDNRSITKVNQVTTTSRVCNGVSVTTTSSVNITGDVLTYTETQTQLAASPASRNKSAGSRAYSFRFDGRKCEALRYIVEGILMSPVSCLVEDGNTAG